MDVEEGSREFQLQNVGDLAQKGNQVNDSDNVVQNEGGKEVILTKWAMTPNCHENRGSSRSQGKGIGK